MVKVVLKYLDEYGAEQEEVIDRPDLIQKPPKAGYYWMTGPEMPIIVLQKPKPYVKPLIFYGEILYKTDRHDDDEYCGKCKKCDNHEEGHWHDYCPNCEDISGVCSSKQSCYGDGILQFYNKFIACIDNTMEDNGWYKFRIIVPAADDIVFFGNSKNIIGKHKSVKSAIVHMFKEQIVFKSWVYYSSIGKINELLAAAKEIGLKVDYKIRGEENARDNS